VYFPDFRAFRCPSQAAESCASFQEIYAFEAGRALSFKIPRSLAAAHICAGDFRFGAVRGDEVVFCLAGRLLEEIGYAAEDVPDCDVPELGVGRRQPDLPRQPLVQNNDVWRGRVRGGLG